MANYVVAAVMIFGGLAYLQIVRSVEIAQFGYTCLCHYLPHLLSAQNEIDSSVRYVQISWLVH